MSTWNGCTDTTLKLNQEAKDNRSLAKAEKAREKAEKAREKAEKAREKANKKLEEDENFALNLAMKSAENAAKAWILDNNTAEDNKKAADEDNKKSQLFKKLSKDTVKCLKEIEERSAIVIPVSSGRRFYGLTDEERIKCAHDYFIYGNLDDVASKNNVNKKDLVDAASQNWWQMEVNNLHREASIRMKLRFTTILNSTLDQLEDRVKNGDVRFNGDGKSYRYPMSAQTLATITNVIFDKKIKLEDRSNGIIEGENRRLVDLANSLTMLVVKDAEVLDENDGEDEHGA
jgi:hypothetical protein